MKNISTAPKIPPEPSSNHDAIDDWTRRGMPDLQPVVSAFDELIRKLIPDLHFAVKWKKAYYGTPKLGWVIEVAAYDVSANIVFFAGAKFDPPPPMGTTGNTRYMKLKSVEEVNAPRVKAWIKQAGKTQGWL